jgi:hypothetical protein
MWFGLAITLIYYAERGILPLFEDYHAATKEGEEWPSLYINDPTTGYSGLRIFTELTS